MALQKNIKLTDNFGIEVEIKNSYIKIPKVECTKNQMNYFVEIKKESNEIPFVSQTKTFDYDLNGENPIKQAYLHLKTLPEFADAVDC
jgi:methionyl-tRNA formyltransferase